MAVVLPFNLKTTKFGIVSGLAQGKDEGGSIINSRNVEPYWAGTLTTPPLTRAERISALALLDDVVDLNQRVDFIHPLYLFPISYDEGSWPLVGDATLSSVTDLRNIVVDDLPAGVMLQAGTRLTIIQDTSICYRKIRATINSAAPIGQTINIGPRLPPGIFAGGASVRLASPFARLIVVPDSWDATEDIEDAELAFDVSETLR